MADVHLTRELLWGVLRGELTPSIVTQMGLEHLMSLCPTCRKEITEFQKERRAATDGDYSRALQLLPALIEKQLPRMECEQRDATKDLEDLLSLSREERVQRVERAHSRFRSSTLVRLLVDESRKRVYESREEAFQLAALARLVVHRNPRMPQSFDLIALTTAHMANASRAGGNLREAEDHFGHARYVVTHHEVIDTEILAQVDHLEGSLRMDQRQFDRAEELLIRAAMFYRVSGDKVGTARVLITLGALCFFRGDTAPAIEATTAALEGLRDSYEPRLYLCARYNLARYLTEDGQYFEASDMLVVDEDLYREFPEPWTQLRLGWLRGKIAAGLGQNGEAERIFLEVRNGFIAQGISYDAAMVSKEDLAELYLREGRVKDMERLTEEIHSIFQAQGVHWKRQR